MMRCEASFPCLKDSEMPEPANRSQRSVLAIPDRKHVGLTTYHAKDSDTSFPPIDGTAAAIPQ
jgi:hypothetical protein